MMTQRILGLILLTIVFSESLRAQQKDRPSDYLCEAKDLPISVPSSALERTILSNMFISSKLKDSWGSLTFKNLLGSPIDAIELVVEYQNEESDMLVQLPYVASTSKKKPEFSLLIPSEYAEILKRPVTAGDSVRLYSEGFVVVSQCPTKARAIAAKVLFTNGQSQTWTSAGWSLTPLLRYFPRDFELPIGSISGSLRLIIRADITPQGEIARVQVIRESAPKSPQPALEALKGWQFYPARKDGQPIQGQVVLLLRVDSAGSQQQGEWEWIGAEDVPMPLSVVDLLQDSSAPTKWKLWYGRRPGDTVLE
jgi:hypothetical protein